MPKNGAFVVHELHTLLGRQQVDVACTKCDRRGRVSVARLIRDFGPDCPLPGVAVELATDCPRRRNSAAIYERCGATFPGIGEALNAAVQSLRR